MPKLTLDNICNHHHLHSFSDGRSHWAVFWSDSGNVSWVKVVEYASGANRTTVSRNILNPNKLLNITQPDEDWRTAVERWYEQTYEDLV